MIINFVPDIVARVREHHNVDEAACVLVARSLPERKGPRIQIECYACPHLQVPLLRRAWSSYVGFDGP